jgi:hypothetical protein
MDGGAFAPTNLRFHGLWPVRAKVSKAHGPDGPRDRKTRGIRFVDHPVVRDRPRFVTSNTQQGPGLLYHQHAQRKSRYIFGRGLRHLPSPNRLASQFFFGGGGWTAFLDILVRKPRCMAGNHTLRSLAFRSASPKSLGPSVGRFPLARSRQSTRGLSERHQSRSQRLGASRIVGEPARRGESAGGVVESPLRPETFSSRACLCACDSASPERPARRSTRSHRIPCRSASRQSAPFNPFTA